MTNGGRGRSEPTAERSARSGSVAGRGYRYQDGVAGYVAVLAVTGELPVDDIYCEGLEDVNFHIGGSAVRAQVKSRRPDLEPRSCVDVATDVAALLRRHRDELADETGNRVALVSESLPAGLTETGWHHTLTPGEESYVRLTEAFAAMAHGPDPQQLRRVSLVHVPHPEMQAVARLTGTADLLPVAAQLVFLRLRQALADSADENHDGVVLKYSRTDLEGLRVSSFEAVNVEALEVAIGQGMVEPLDLTTPLEESGFYLGVDVQPGHLVAGYLIPRPDETAKIVQGLHDRRAVLVAGPSGAGKSALTWLAAAETAGEVTWYRVKRLTADAVEPIARLARALGEGNAGCRIGLIVDDVGRTPGPWDELTAFAAGRPGVVLLGSIREEDLPLVTGLQHVEVERPYLDEKLAESIYNRIREKDRTTWSGWREPFEAANGLLMEYVHILTAGSRLEDTIARQVQARLSNSTRHDELAVLRLVAMAHTYGCNVGIPSVRRYLNLTDDQIGSALQRLYDEHLVRKAGAGMIGGLHQLRSDAIVRTTHAMNSPTREETARRLLVVLEGIDITVFIAAALEPSPSSGEDPLRSIGMADTAAASLLDVDVVKADLRERLEARSDVPLVTAVLQGLRIAGFRRTAREWWQIMDDAGTPIPLRQVLTNFALTNSDLTGSSFPAILVSLVRRLREHPVTDLRHGMEDAVSRALESGPVSVTARELEGLLLAAAQWAGGEDAVRAAAVEKASRLSDVPLTVAIDVLKAAATHSIATAASVADSLGGEADLLARYAAEQPWLYDVGRETDESGVLAIRARWLFIDTPFAHGDPTTLSASDADNVNDAVVECCRDLLALQPSAAVAKVAAVDATGQPAGFGGHIIADKAIPRENLPTTGAVVWNRIRLVTADTLAWATTTTTDRLVAEADLLRRLAEAMKAFASHWIVGTYSRRPVSEDARLALSELDDAGEMGTTLPSPSSPVSVGVVLRTLADPRVMPELPTSNATADVVTSIVTNLVPRLVESSPTDQSIGAYIGNSILPALERLGRDVQWRLVETDVAESVSALLEVLHDLHDFLEARKGRSERDVRRLQNDVTGRPSPLALAAQVVRDSAATEASQIAQRLCDRLQSSIGGAGHVEVVVRAHGDRYGPIWPPHDFGVLVRSDDPLILGKSEADLRAAKDLLPIVAEMTAVPVIRDLVIAPLAIKVYSGITLPSPESGVDAAASAGLPVLESKSYEAASGVVAALVAMSAVLMLRARRGNRPIEEEIYARAEAKFLDGVLVIHQGASIAAGEEPAEDLEAMGPMTSAARATIPGEALSLIMQWAGRVEAEQTAVITPGGDVASGGDFAATVAQTMRGQEPEMLGMMAGVNVLLMLYDLDPMLAAEFLESL